MWDARYVDCCNGPGRWSQWSACARAHWEEVRETRTSCGVACLWRFSRATCIDASVEGRAMRCGEVVFAADLWNTPDCIR